MNKELLPQALAALERQASMISSMEQYHPLVTWHSLPDLRDEVARACTALRKAIAQGEILAAVQAAGASVQTIELGALRIVRENPPRFPEAWAVRASDFTEYLLSKDGALDVIPATITPEWRDSHYFRTAQQALAVAVAYTAKKGGAA